MTENRIITNQIKICFIANSPGLKNIQNFFNSISQELFQKYNVTLTYIIKNTFDDVTNAFKAGNPEKIDMFINLPHDRLQDYISKDGVKELNYNTSLFSKNSLLAVSSENKIYGFPTTYEAVALIKKKNISSNKNDILTNKINIPRPDDPYHFYSLLTSFGTQIFKIENNQWTKTVDLNDDVAVKFGQFIRKYKKDKIIAEDIYGINACFRQKKCGSVITGPWFWGKLVEIYGPKFLNELTIESVPKFGGYEPTPFSTIRASFVWSGTTQFDVINKIINQYIITDTGMEVFRGDGLSPYLNINITDEFLKLFKVAIKNSIPMPGFMETTDKNGMSVWNYMKNYLKKIYNNDSAQLKEEWMIMKNGIKNIFPEDNIFPDPCKEPIKILYKESLAKKGGIHSKSKILTSSGFKYISEINTDDVLLNQNKMPIKINAIYYMDIIGNSNNYPALVKNNLISRYQTILVKNDLVTKPVFDNNSVIKKDTKFSYYFIELESNCDNYLVLENDIYVESYSEDNNKYAYMPQKNNLYKKIKLTGN